MAFGNKDNLEFLLSVADVLLLDAKTGTQLASATLKSHSMNQTVDTTEIRAGQANDVLATIKNNKTIEITIEDVQQKHDFIAMMLGGKMEDAAASVDAYELPKGIALKSSTELELPQAPKEGETVKVTDATGKGLGTLEGNGSDKVVTVSGEALKATDIVYVSGYAYEAPAKSQKIVIKSDRFAGSYKMVLDEQVFDADMQIIARKQTVFHKVIPNDSFTLDGSSERAEKTASYTFTVALVPGEEELGYILYIPEEEAQKAE